MDQQTQPTQGGILNQAAAAPAPGATPAPAQQGALPPPNPETMSPVVLAHMGGHALGLERLRRGAKAVQVQQVGDRHTSMLAPA